MLKSILVIDAMYLTFSSFYSHKNMRTLKGEHTGAIYGFVSRVENLINELKPEALFVAFDSKGKVFRHKIYPEYKAKRLLPPEELIAQLPYIKEYLDLRGINYLEAPGFEADDIIAKISKSFGKKGCEIIIFTADKDLFQLVNDNVCIYHPKLKRKLYKEGVMDCFGVSPDQIVDYLSLMGDSSDNIPGVPGVGEKTAKKLIAKYETLDNMFNRIDELDENLRKKIKSNIKLLELSKQLIDLDSSPQFELEFKEEKFKNETNSRLISFYRKLSFNSFLKKIEKYSDKKESILNIKYNIVRDLLQLRDLKNKIIKEKYFSFDIETTGIEFFKSQIVGLSISFINEGYYIPFVYTQKESKDLAISFNDFVDEMNEVFGDEKIKKTGHNLKFDVLHLRQNGIDVKGIEHDSMIMSYLLFPNRRTHRLKDLTLEFLNYNQVKYDDLIGKFKNNSNIIDVEIEKLSHYCIDDSNLSLKLIDVLINDIEKKGLYNLYKNIEMPLIKVLADIEFCGVKIDVEFLRSASKKMEEKIIKVKKEIFDIAGYEFNLNSSQQLGEFLFERMNLPIKKRTRKTKSYSTDIEVLKGLRSFSVVEKIIDYRSYKKLLSTYLIGLIDDIDENSRVHTSFNQTVAATGRLSSSKPNIQNIPKGELGGVNVRKSFVSQKDMFLLSADYSQIELRVMAHFSKDKNLIEAFENDFDIHQQTANTVLGNDLFLNEYEKRKKAKIINFSILYGSGPFSLSKELGVSYKDAKNFIDQYFDRYVGVKDFIEEVIKKAEHNPVVETISGRKREIPEIISSNKTVRENGKRMAINTIIQGSAADIIKIAMINIHKELVKMESNLIMQVHDELVFEYPEKEEKRLIKLVRREMVNAMNLRVPLKVTIERGKNWGEMKELEDRIQ